LQSLNDMLSLINKPIWLYILKYIYNCWSSTIWRLHNFIIFPLDYVINNILRVFDIYYLINWTSLICFNSVHPIEYKIIFNIYYHKCSDKLSKLSTPSRIFQLRSSLRLLLNTSKRITWLSVPLGLTKWRLLRVLSRLFRKRTSPSQWRLDLLQSCFSCSQNIPSSSLWS